MLPPLLDALAFRTNLATHRPIIKALAVIKANRDSRKQHFTVDGTVPIEGVIPPNWCELVLEHDPNGEIRVNRINYEISALHSLREGLRCKAIWVAGADRFRNPDDDLPADFDMQRTTYYAALQQPESAEDFIAGVRHAMEESLSRFNEGLPKNPKVTLRAQGKNRIKLSPLDPQPEPANILRVKAELMSRWPMTSLLDVLKETDLRVGFSDAFHSVASREVLDRTTLQPRLLRCLYGLGTNAGLKRMVTGDPSLNYHDLLYIRRRYIHKDALREAIARIANATFAIRRPEIWGEGTTSCASDAKKFGAWDQNLMTEWHIRYGGKGVMIYWHVEKKSVCIYSQLKRCSSSEVAAMIEGVLRHCTEMEVEQHYVDSHGQSVILTLVGYTILREGFCETQCAPCHETNRRAVQGLPHATRYRIGPTTGVPLSSSVLTWINPIFLTEREKSGCLFADADKMRVVLRSNSSMTAVSPSRWSRHFCATWPRGTTRQIRRSPMLMISSICGAFSRPTTSRGKPFNRFRRSTCWPTCGRFPAPTRCNALG